MGPRWLQAFSSAGGHDENFVSARSRRPDRSSGSPRTPRSMSTESRPEKTRSWSSMPTRSRRFPREALGSFGCDSGVPRSGATAGSTRDPSGTRRSSTRRLGFSRWSRPAAGRQPNGPVTPGQRTTAMSMTTGSACRFRRVLGSLVCPRCRSVKESGNRILGSLWRTSAVISFPEAADRADRQPDPRPRRSTRCSGT